jgi:uncharacterized YccA/Bax inhibitor family protein
MANPSFNDKLMQRISVADQAGTDTMTISGTINKTGILLLITMTGGFFGWNSTSPLMMFGFLILALILSMVIIFGPQRAPMLAPIYAFTEGYVIGSVSYFYSFRYPGIASNAMMLTFGCLAAMLFLYRTKIIKVDDRFRSIIVGATGAIAIAYLINIVMGLFGSSIPMLHEASPIGIGFSVLVVLVAAFNLLLDFDQIENLSARRAPKFMEWYGAFALLVTLVWLYLEMLRLLSKLNKR